MNSHKFRNKSGFYQLNISTSKRRPLPLEEIAIEEEIIQCNRTALVDRVSTIGNELKYLQQRYPTLQFVKSKETVYRFSLAWTFCEAMFYRLPAHFRLIVECGIDSHVVEEFHDRIVHVINIKALISNSSTDDANITWSKVAPLKLTDSIQTIFYICLMVVAIALIVFASELVIIELLLAKPYQNQFHIAGFYLM